MRVRRATLAAFAALLCWLRPCAAEPPGTSAADIPLDLSWTAPEGCPNADDVKAQIAHLTRAPVRDGARRLQAAARVDAAPGGVWRVALETREGNAADSRELAGDSCEAVAGSVAVVLALRLDALDEPAVEATPLPAPVAAPPAPPESAPATTPKVGRRPPRFSVGVALSADTSALPEPTAGATVQLAFRPGRTYVGLSGTYWIPRDVTFGGDGEGRFRWGTASIAGCQGLLGLGGSAHLGPCLALEAGGMSAESFGVRVPGRTTELWLAARAGARLAVDVSRTVSLALVLEAAVPLRRPSFVIEGVGVVHQPSPVSGRAALAAEWVF